MKHAVEGTQSRRRWASSGEKHATNMPVGGVFEPRKLASNTVGQPSTTSTRTVRSSGCRHVLPMSVVSAVASDASGPPSSCAHLVVTRVAQSLVSNGMLRGHASEPSAMHTFPARQRPVLKLTENPSAHAQENHGAAAGK